MKKCTIKKVLSFSILSFILLSVFAFSPVPIKAADGEVNLWGDSMEFDGDDLSNVGVEAFDSTGLSKRDPRIIAANLIRILLGLLGVIAVVLIIVGGFKWMTASGNEENIKKAQQLIGAGIIGLLIVLAAYAITMFVLRSFLSALGSDTPSGQYSGVLE